MNIGIDVDGVLIDIGNFVRENGEKYFEKKHNISIYDPSAYSVKDIFNCHKTKEKGFWFNYAIPYWISEPCIKDCSSVINKLHENGNDIYIITSRIFTKGSTPIHKFLQGKLKNWLHRNQIYYDRIVFCSEKKSPEEKLSACRKFDIDVLIDDLPKNLYAVKDDVVAICYDSPWNKDVEDDKIKRVYSWDEIYYLLTGDVV